MHEKLGQILAQARVMPVLTVERIDDAVPLARALVAGGLKVLEVTLRRPDAVQAIAAMVREVPGAIVGAGTVLTEDQLKSVKQAGAVFAISPGASASLVAAAKQLNLPYLPAVATGSEIMEMHALGVKYLKFFPAEAAGGAGALKHFAGPFPDIQFCPTGGVSPSNAKTYFALPNVICVGGSWVAPVDKIHAGGWASIEQLARQAASL